MAEYLLSIEQVEDLFDFVAEKLDETECDHSRRYTQEWLDANIPEDEHNKVLAEIEDMGGFCDCEVLMNCYEDYMDEIYPEDDEG